MLRASLETMPRVGLVQGPTPLQPLPRLSEHLGVETWVKRDDLGATGLGGNKLRKLEYLLGEAVEEGCDTIVTFGALQSNHARQTAAACARLGLACHLVLSRMVDRTDEIFATGGNVLLDELFGATLHVCHDRPEDRDRVVGEIEAGLAETGARTFWIPPGGSAPTGCLGYVAAGLELCDQMEAAGIRFGDVVLASSTGGTQAGLLLGQAASAAPTRVSGVAVYQPAEDTSSAVGELVAGTLSLLSADGGRTVSPDDVGWWEPSIRVLDGFRGAGYGLPTEEMREALCLFARLEGIVLDPVYTGKAAAALVAGCRDGSLGAREAVVLLHTGGAPGLFAYGRDGFDDG